MLEVRYKPKYSEMYSAILLVAIIAIISETFLFGQHLEVLHSSCKNLEKHNST